MELRAVRHNVVILQDPPQVKTVSGIYVVKTEDHKRVQKGTVLSVGGMELRGTCMELWAESAEAFGVKIGDRVYFNKYGQKRVDMRDITRIGNQTFNATSIPENLNFENEEQKPSVIIMPVDQIFFVYEDAEKAGFAWYEEKKNSSDPEAWKKEYGV